MANYLITHYKGKYRILCDYDKTTNQFSRKLDGTFEDIDCYITCQKDVKIYYYGKSILEAYIPSVIRGKNIVKAVNDEFGNDIWLSVVETDEEIILQFHAKHMDKLEKYFKPKTNGSDISPFSIRNLPKNKTYKIPDEEFVLYKNIVDKIPKNNVLAITHTTNSYLKSLVNKRNTFDKIKADMQAKGLKGKEYIHSIGKWNDYINYLEKELCK